MTDRVDDASPEQLRESGLLAEAAAAYRRRGDLARAEALYAELWDFSAAAEVAHERGDRPAELGHRLAANDLPAATLVGAELEHGTEHELRRAAEIYERHRRWPEAAALRERLGELAPARELYRRAQAFLEVARLERALGRLREAGVAYEQLLAQAPDGSEAARAHLELGQLLVALDRVDEGARHLRRAANLGVAQARAAALADLAVAIDRLGYTYACDAVLDELRAIAPDTPQRAAFLDRHRPPPIGGATRLGGRYEIERLLGAGATGRVFLAKDAISGRAVAAKLLAPVPEGRARLGRARFFAESRMVGTLRHPNVVEVLDLDEELGLLVMEFLPGGTLLDRLPPPGDGGRPLAPAAVRRLLLDVLDALMAVHTRGIIHRDLKPANLFYTATGQVRLGDFGAAHLYAEEATQTAGFIGTLAYMAPEQISGGAIDFAADVYSLGAIAFQALTGQLAFPGPDFVAQHLGDPPPLPSARVQGLDPAWDRVIVGMLQKSPDARPPSLEGLRRDIERIKVDDESRWIERAPPLPREKDERPRYIRTSALPDGAGGAIALGTDTRLGRSVVIETLAVSYLSGPHGERHLRWLRELARLGGPRLQRLFALVHCDDGSVDAIFESTLAPLASPPSPARARLRSSLAALHAAGIAHGAIASSVVYLPHGPALLVAGRAPRSDASVEGDLAALAAFP